MNGKKRTSLALLLILVIMGVAGCNTDYKQLLQKAQSTEEPLIRVQIQFTDKEQTICYVKSLGLEEDGQIYTGGTSLNYMYDSNGNIIGSFNYQRVIYMKIVTDGESTE